MSDHIFMRLCGYGWTILPRTPFHLQRLPGAERTLILRSGSPMAAKRAQLAIKDEGYRVDLDPGTASLQAVADLSPGSYSGDWLIETSVFSTSWPHGFDLVSSPDAAIPPGFDLVGPDGRLLSIQGLFASSRLPPAEQMAAPGQVTTQIGDLDGASWVELAYEHESRRWVQRHYLVPFRPGWTLVLTLQAPAGMAVGSIAAAEELARTLRPGPGAG